MKADSPGKRDFRRAPDAGSRTGSQNLVAWRTAAHALLLPNCPVWNRAWRLACDIGPSLAASGPSDDNSALADCCAGEAAAAYASLLREGASAADGHPLVYVPTLALPDFVSDILPRVPRTRRFVLVTGLADFGPARSLGRGSAAAGRSAALALAADPCILAWFAEMVDFEEEEGGDVKVQALPLGIDLHTLAFKPGERPLWGPPASPRAQAMSLARAAMAATHSDPRALCLWGVLNRKRKAVSDAVLARPDTFDVEAALGSLSRAECWRRMSEHVAVVSIEGYGPDCHRTWETLVLGSVVVVQDLISTRRLLLGPCNTLASVIVDDASAGTRAWPAALDGDALARARERAGSARGQTYSEGDSSAALGLLGALARATLGEASADDEAEDMERLPALPIPLLARTYISAMRASALMRQ